MSEPLKKYYTYDIERMLTKHEQFFACIVATGREINRQWLVREAQRLLAELEGKT